MDELGRARGRTATWRPWAAPSSAPWPVPWHRPGFAWPQSLADLANGITRQLHAWAIAEVGPGRLVPWLAIAFGCGIVVYFSADHEPAPWAAAVVVGAAVAMTILVRHRPI